MVRESSSDTLAASSFGSEESFPSSRSVTPAGSRRPSQTLDDPFLEPFVTAPKMSTSADLIPSSNILGQFSYAPATKTTVVTTTTTTTTSFPPLVIKTPTHLHELDAHLYPLAASPTPSSIKQITFNLGGRSTIFREIDCPSRTSPSRLPPKVVLAVERAKLTIIQANQGSSANRTFKRTLRSEPKASDSEHLEIAVEEGDITTPTQTRNPSGDATRATWNTTPPVSISDAAHLVNAQKVGARGLDSREIRRRRNPARNPANLSRLQICQTATPVTPSPALCTSQPSETRTEFASQSASTILGQASLPRTSAEGLSEHQDASLRTRIDPTDSLRASSHSMQPHDLRISPPRDENPGSTSSHTLPSLANTSRRPRPTIVDTTATHDASLPSPGLSPVTAAANLQDEYFARSHTLRSDNHSALNSPPQDCANAPFANLPRPVTRMRDVPPLWTASEPMSNTPASPSRVLSMLQVPDILETFESMPGEMKTYIMYQLLRRCPKPVLHFVASVVDPALKCDFLDLLPIELSQQIISHLDLKTLCRAAQASKRWRIIVDSDEKVWKNRFDADGFVLPPGELQQAILQGWGWQFGSAPHDFEQNIGDPELFRRSGKWPLAMASVNGADPASSTAGAISHGPSKRPKRKAASKSKQVSRKQQKKKDSRLDLKAELESEALFDFGSASDGPYAAAQAASRAVPISQVGLPTLRNLHLYKSLYRRHYLIRSSWVRDDVKPRHLAFKAHGRHVVTCLQFDSDKILTGSEDTNIHVYDTQTGALRARLTGHEGGVWALEYHGNTLVSGSTDRSVRVWDIEQGECKHVFAGHTSTVRCLVILLPTEVGKKANGKPQMMPEEPLIITGSRDSTLRVWRLPRPEEPSSQTSTPAPSEEECPFFVRALNGHVHSVRTIAAHADTLVSGSYDFTVRVWKISTGETIHRLTGHTQKVYSVVLDQERNRCISGSMDYLVKVWDLEHGDLLYNLGGHSSLVGLLDLQGNRLVSAAADYTLRIWDPETGHCKSTLAAHTGAITCFQHDARKVISGSDRSLKMWDVKTGEFTRDLLRDLNGVWQVKFDQRRCVAAVQRESQTFVEVLDYGASRDGVSESQLGRRTVVDYSGTEVGNVRDSNSHLEAVLVDVD